MKNKVYLLFIFSFFSAVVFADNSIKIAGILNNSFNGFKITLGVQRADSVETFISTIERGIFQFTVIPIQTYQHCYLRLEKDTVEYHSEFFASNNNVFITLTRSNMPPHTNPFKNATFKGAYFTDEIAEYQNSKEKKILDELYVYFGGNFRKANKEKQDSIRSVMVRDRTALLKKRIEFVKEHNDQYFSLYYFNRDIKESSYLSLDSIYNVYNGFSNNIKNTSLGEKVDRYLKNRIAVMLGKVAPDLTFFNSENKKSSLKEVKDKYILLCFWASWCQPCVAHIPQLKTIDSLYASQGLQLVSISIDAEKNDWVNAVGKYKMPWPQGLDIYKSEKNARNIYGLYAIPQYFLLDKDYKIIYHSDQSQDDDEATVLKSKLTTIFAR